ncbi:MAG: SDR family NAD(P)-dependent oxidoreductase, partial [Acidobacteriota bacterium]
APAAAAGPDPVEEKVLQLVADKTGYPQDMLALDLDLEADLGIDTVKQAEMFAAVREAYGIERDDDLQLRDFPTLAHVTQFVYDKRPDLKSDAATASEPSVVSQAPVEPATPKPVGPAIAGDLDAARAIPRRVPVAMLRPAVDLCRPTGVALNHGSRVIVMHDRGGVGDALVRRLENRGVAVMSIDDRPSAELLEARLSAWLDEGPIDGVYWLAALDVEPELTEMDLDGWREALSLRVKLLYTTMRTLAAASDRQPAFLVSATRLGGRHGYDEQGAVAPMGGAVVGFTKAYKRERSAALVKAVDFEVSRRTAALAERLIDETLADPGIVEVGYADELRWAVGFEEQILDERQQGLQIDKQSVFVVTGAAGSIVSAITADLASASGGTFHLLDLTPEPDPESEDLARFSTDREGLQREIFERLKQAGERATPARVDKELAALERSHAALSAIRAVEAAGGQVFYHSVNLLEADAVARVIDEVRERYGRIDVLLHAAGIEISHFLSDKTPGEFALVFDVKSEGWFHLLRAIGEMPLGSAVVFSSVAGRFGNAGQTDYSAANDLLCKSVSHLASRRPGTLGLAIDWTAWGDIGMATRGSIPKMMEQAGIDMLPAAAGIPIVRRELTAGAPAREVVIGKRLGVLLEPFDAAGGLDADAVFANSGHGQIRPPMIGELRGIEVAGDLIAETELDPGRQPFLDDHKIDSTSVLPGVMGIEAFAELARLAFPDRHVIAVEDVDFLAPFKFFRQEPRSLCVRAVFGKDASSIVAQCELIGVRQLANQPEPQVTRHFTGRVRLATDPVSEPKRRGVPSAAPGAVTSAAEIYEIFFHGPAYRVLERAWRNGKQIVGLMSDSLPPNHLPESAPTLMAPRLIELCFQTAGVWELGSSGRMGLPQHVDRVVTLRSAESASGRLYAVVEPNALGTVDAHVVDDEGRVYLMLQGYRTIGLAGGPDDRRLEPLRRAVRESQPSPSEAGHLVDGSSHSERPATPPRRSLKPDS